MKNKIDFQKYDLILFSDKTTNRSVTKSGYKIGKFLVVARSDSRIGDDARWRIYRYTDGLPCIKTTFLTCPDAILFAEWLNEQYESFFFLWTEYPNAELFRWTYLTIENGEKYWKFLDALDKQRNVGWEDVCQHIS